MTDADGATLADAEIGNLDLIAAAPRISTSTTTFASGDSRSVMTLRES